MESVVQNHATESSRWIFGSGVINNICCTGKCIRFIFKGHNYHAHSQNFRYLITEKRFGD
jgi:hypothetical protein